MQTCYYDGVGWLRAPPICLRRLNCITWCRRVRIHQLLCTVSEPLDPVSRALVLLRVLVATCCVRGLFINFVPACHRPAISCCGRHAYSRQLRRLPCKLSYNGPHNGAALVVLWTVFTMTGASLALRWSRNNRLSACARPGYITGMLLPHTICTSLNKFSSRITQPVTGHHRLCSTQQASPLEDMNKPSGAATHHEFHAFD
jgi:hypothetical protein